MITARDMGNWLLNFETMQVGGKAAIAATLQPGKLNNGKQVDYGFGVGLGEHRHTQMVSHTGGWAGVSQAQCFVFLKSGWGWRSSPTPPIWTRRGSRGRSPTFTWGLRAQNPAPEKPAKAALPHQT